MNGKLYGFKANKFHEYSLKSIDQKQRSNPTKQKRETKNSPNSSPKEEAENFTLRELGITKFVQPRSDPIFVKMYDLENTTQALFFKLVKDQRVLNRIRRKLMIFIHFDLSNNKLMFSVMEDITLIDETAEDLATVIALQNVMSYIDSRSSNISIDATEDWDNYGKI